MKNLDLSNCSACTFYADFLWFCTFWAYLHIKETSFVYPDKSGWDELCGKYDYAIGDFRIEEIFRKDDELYARAYDDDTAPELRLYPLGEKTFGIKDLDADLTLSDGTLTLYGVTSKKTE